MQVCYASHMAESPMEVILEVRYAWYKIHFFRRKNGGRQPPKLPSAEKVNRLRGN